MPSFLELLQKYSNYGMFHGQIGGGLFDTTSPGNFSPDKDLQRLNQTAFDINNFIGGEINGMKPVAPTEQELKDLADGAQEGSWNIENILTGGWADTKRAQNAVAERLDEYNTEVENYQNTLSTAQEYAPVIGGMAALQELNSMEAQEQQLALKKRLQDPNLYRVNPTNGMANFQYEDGGDPHKIMQKMKLPKDFKVPRLNLSGVHLASMEGLQHYQFGGAITNRTPVGNYKSEIDATTSFFEGLNRVPIQAESGGPGKEEMIVLPTLDIVPVAAEKRHKNVDRDLVTDYIPEGSYIFSQYGDIIIKKDDAEQLTTELGVKPYSLYGKTELPSKKTLADLMDKNKMSPADIARNIKNTFKQSERRDDPFTDKTNMANKETSIPYIQALTLLSEIEKNKLGIVSEYEQQQLQNNSAETENNPTLGNFSNGGYVYSNKPPRAVLPTLIGPLIGLGSTLIGSFMGDRANRSAQAEARKLRDENLADIERLSNEQQGNNALATGASVFSQLLQDTTIDTPQLDTSGLLAQRTGVAQNTLDNITNSNFRNINQGAIFSQAPTFAAGVNASVLPQAQAMQANTNMQYQNAAQKLDRENAILGNIQNIINQQRGIEVAASNQQRGLNNQRLVGIGGAVAGGLNTQNNILGNETNARLAARGAAFSAISQLQNQRAQNFLNTGAAVSQLVPSMMDGINQMNQQQNQVPISAPAQIQTIQPWNNYQRPQVTLPPSMLSNLYYSAPTYDIPTGIPG